MDNNILFNELINKLKYNTSLMAPILIIGTDWHIWPEASVTYSPIGYAIQSTKTEGLILKKTDPILPYHPTYELISSGAIRKRVIQKDETGQIFWELGTPCPSEEEAEVRRLFVKALMQLV
jgi:hypothetical protein